MKKPMYKLLDEKGRVLIPLEMRQKAEMEKGDTAVKILIAVVIGALLLAGLYALFGDVVMPAWDGHKCFFAFVK